MPERPQHDLGSEQLSVLKFKAEHAPGVATGPRTLAGKKQSSQNALTHGMRSAKLVLADERQQDYDYLADGWSRAYQPDNYVAQRLVQQVALNDWLLKRAERRVIAAEAALVEEAGYDPMKWSEEQHKRIQLMYRYKTTAERAFQRAFHELEGLRKEGIKTLRDYQRARQTVQQQAEKEKAKAGAVEVRETLRRKRDEERRAERLKEKDQDEARRWSWMTRDAPEEKSSGARASKLRGSHNERR